MNIQPTLDRVLIEPDDEQKPQAGIIIPERYRKAGTKGTVVAVGPGRRHIDGKLYGSSIKVGDRVIYGKMNLFPFSDGGKDYVMVHDQDIICVLAES